MKKIVIALLLLALAACSKVTAENYEKLQAGMGRDEVVKLLGEPSSSDAAALLGLKRETAIWQHGSLTIEADFLNGKLLTHSMKTK